MQLGFLTIESTSQQRGSTGRIWEQFSFAWKVKRLVEPCRSFSDSKRKTRERERERDEKRKEKKDSRSNVRLINNASSVAFNCTSNEQILHFFFFSFASQMKVEKKLRTHLANYAPSANLTRLSSLPIIFFESRVSLVFNRRREKEIFHQPSRWKDRGGGGIFDVYPFL